jgi:hypothetical protein
MSLPAMSSRKGFAGGRRLSATSASTETLYGFGGAVDHDSVG